MVSEIVPKESMLMSSIQKITGAVLVVLLSWSWVAHRPNLDLGMAVQYCITGHFPSVDLTDSHLPVFWSLLCVLLRMFLLILHSAPDWHISRQWREPCSGKWPATLDICRSATTILCLCWQHWDNGGRGESRASRSGSQLYSQVAILTHLPSPMSFLWEILFFPCYHCVTVPHVYSLGQNYYPP